MYTYLQVKHTASSGDILGQPLTYNSKNEYLLEWHSQMKNAINNADVIGMNVLVVDNQLKKVHEDKWVRSEGEPEDVEAPE